MLLIAYDLRGQMDILLSFIIPVYNVEKYLPECLDSVVAQKGDDIEIIIVDDGSTDGSGNVCDYYASKYDYIKVIHKENEGLVSARKTGLSKASGKYIMCLDGDDWMEDNALTKIKEVVLKYSPEVICMGYRDVFVDNNTSIDRTIPVPGGYYSTEDIESSIYPILFFDNNGRRFPSCIWAKVYAAEIYRAIQNGISDDVSINEDTFVSIPCICKAKSIYILDDILYCYRKRTNSMSGGLAIYKWTMPEQAYNYLKAASLRSEKIFNEQFKKRIIEILFVTGVTQFYGDKGFLRTCSNIKYELKKNYVNYCISGVRLGIPNRLNLNFWIMCFSIKYKVALPMALVAYRYILSIRRREKNS